MSLFPSSRYLTNALPEGDVDSALVREYEDIFIKVNNWGTFEDSDIEQNGLRQYVEYVDGTVPDFVAEFERELDSKPGLAPDAYHEFKTIRDVEIRDAYFGPLKKKTVEDGSPEEFTFENEPHRLAGYLEVNHVSHIAAFDWGRYWHGNLGRTLNESLMNTVFFHCFALQRGTITTVLTSNLSWPFHLITKSEYIPVNEQLRKYRPRSDLLVLQSGLPRLLVEVNTPINDNILPEALVGMLLMGAAVVRFANKFLDAFMKNKNFVLCAIYIWDGGRVTRDSLFQEPNNPEVRYKETQYWLNYSVDLAKFGRQLFTLQDKIAEHNRKYPMVSFYMEDTPGNEWKRVTRDDDDDDDDSDNGGAGGVCTTDCADLRAHGYKVKPRVGDIVDEKGGVWKAHSKSKKPSHILTVYQRSDPSKEFIAKKVREQSNELEFLNRLNTFRPKSEHIISLHQSFQKKSTWAILPRMDSIADYLVFEPDQLYEKVAQVCWGLIKGVAYLHKFCIAHRDIKPENLLVDRNFCLKITDFDVAIQVEDEDEMVDGQCGTKFWTAPEIEKSMYSPIKADRWSTGRVVLYLLERSRKLETVLRTTARKLAARNPEERPSMLQFAASLSDVENVAVKRKAPRSLQDTVEVDGENAEHPSAKKQKL